MTINLTFTDTEPPHPGYDRDKTVKFRILRQYPGGFGNCCTETHIAVSIETSTNVLFAQYTKVDVRSGAEVYSVSHSVDALSKECDLSTKLVLNNCIKNC